MSGRDNNMKLNCENKQQSDNNMKPNSENEWQRQ